MQWHKLLEAMLKDLDGTLEERAREVEARAQGTWSRSASTILAGLLQGLVRTPAGRSGDPLIGAGS